MKTTPIFGKAIPHIIAILIFLTVSGIYFAPQFKGYKLNQSDHRQALGMSQEIRNFREMYNSEPLWTNSMFAGMPAYQISGKNFNYVHKLKNVIVKIVHRPTSDLFFLMLGAYIMLLCFNVNPWVSILGGIVFGLSSMNILLLATGHISKVNAISFIPPLLGGLIYTYRKNQYVGSAVFALFVCLQLASNHVQMTYYSLFMLVAVVIVELIHHYHRNNLAGFFKKSALLLIAGIIAILPGISTLLTTYEYGKHTTRGQSELTISASNQSSTQPQKNEALDSEYIRRYSLGYGEIWSLVIPNIKGGAMGYIGQEEKVMKKIRPEFRSTIAQQSSYWGEQYTSGGAFYLGSGMFLLFILGLFFLKDKIKWAILAVTILSIILSWKYSQVLEVFIQHFPLFNKFRDTKMMLVLVQISFPLIGFLFVNHILRENAVSRKKFLYISLILSGVILLLYALPKTWFDFLSRAELQQFGNLQDNYNSNPNALSQINLLKNEIIYARIEIYRQDCLRSLGFVIATAIVLYLFMIHKIKKTSFIVLLGLVMFIDFWIVDKRYLNNEKRKGNYIHWVKSFQYKNPFQATVADNEILENEIAENPSIKQKIENQLMELSTSKQYNRRQIETEKDKTKFRILNFATNYRVFSLLNPFISARTSYFHKSIGGYHGAKLKKYQELIDFYIVNEYAKLSKTFSQGPDQKQLVNFFQNETPILNMLNTKYIIYDLSSSPIVNTFHFGNAWFVDSIEFVKNANEEIISLASIDKNRAIIRDKHKNSVPLQITFDPGATITMTTYKPNHIIYESSAHHPQFAVFSEIYYEDGWNAYLDDHITNHLRVNYTLRGMNIPEGNHTIEFKFEPELYDIGKNISYTGSALIFLFITGMVILHISRDKKEKLLKKQV